MESVSPVSAKWGPTALAPSVPERDDANFLKATLAVYDKGSDSARIEYGGVDTSLVSPRARTYGKKADAVVKPEAVAAV